ncbi:MAG: hypothetical protein AAGL98_07310, partial [Planctomycetota bacterium]
IGLGGPGQGEQICNSTESRVYGDYFISAWTQNYNGWHCRTWDGNGRDQVYYFWINMQQNTASGSSGYDAGIGKNEYGGTRLTRMDDNDRINRGMYYKFDNGLRPRSGGYWWMGPKTVISTTQYYSGLDGQYECYLVDNSNLAPDDIVSKLGLQYVSEGNYDGSLYKHYKVKLNQINQVWSIRQNYRNEGWSSVNWIQRQWVLSRLVPRNAYNLGWKINIETAGKMASGSNCGFSYLNLPYNDR